MDVQAVQMMRIGVASEDIYSYYTLDDGRCEGFLHLDNPAFRFDSLNCTTSLTAVEIVWDWKGGANNV